MNKGKTQSRATLLGALLLLGAVGCGITEQEVRVEQTFTALKEVTETFSNVRNHLTTAVSSLKGNERLGPDHPELVKALAEAEKLPLLGGQLQRIKELADRLEDRTSPEFREDLARRFRDKLRSGIVDLITEEAKTSAALREAEQHATDKGKRDMLDAIRSSLQKGREAFEVLTKQR